MAEVIEGVAGGIPRQELEAIADGKAEPGGRAALARVYDLSYHFDAAGDHRHALAYALVAATQARNQYALDVAAQQYAVAERNAEGTPDDVRFRIARGRGEALLQLGRYEDARPELRHAADLSRRLYDKADVQGLLGELAYKLGGTAESIAWYEGAIQKLGIKVPRSPSRFFWELARESAVQLAHRLLPSRLHRGSPDSSADLANRLLARLEYAYYCNNAIKLLWASLVGLNGAERLPPSPALAFNYVVHANDMAVFGWHSRASRFSRAAIDLSRELNDEWGAAQSLNHSAMGELQAGRYESAIAKAAPGKAIFTKLGDLYETHFAHLTTAYSQYGLGNLATAMEEARWIFESAVRNGDNAFASIVLLPWARASLGTLPFDELMGCIRLEAENNLCNSGVLLGESHWHRRHGRTAEAVAACEKAWDICRRNACIMSLNSCVLVELVTALRVHAEVLHQREPIEAERVRQRSRRLARFAAILSRFMPTERPHALRELSLAWMSRGRLSRAWKLAARSCDGAGRMNARYEYAQSLLVQGRLAKRLGRPEADDQIREAESELARIEDSVGASRAEPTS